jgi:co-chaperonin GroES (HSP10)
MKEQLSTSENPKLKLALAEKYKEETEKLPKPTGWRLLVLPFRMDEKTKGGLLLGQDTLDKQQVASQCGNVLAMGPFVIRIRRDIRMVRGARSVTG